MTDDKSINVPSYGKLNFIDLDYKNFLRGTTILYGASKTGKTFITKHILSILKPHIPNIIVICPTNDANNDYTGIIPSRCIYKEINVEILKQIYDRQSYASDVWVKVNNINNLQKFFKKINNAGANNIEDKILRLFQSYISRIETSNLDYAQKKEQINQINEKKNEQLIKLYKNTIHNFKLSNETGDCTEQERLIMKYLYLNPSLLLIMDDCASEIGKWGDDEIIKKIFFQGRHLWITSIYTMQNDKGLASEIRLNAFNNFFTDPNSAMRFFNNTANAFDRATKKKAIALIEFIFNSGTASHKKLVYNRFDPKQFRYIIADDVVDFRFGSPLLWKLSDIIPTKAAVKQDTKFSKLFTVE
jgi:hypothetical protein